MNAENRASRFITLQYIVMRESNDTLDPPPNDIRKLLELSGHGKNHPLLKPFPEGLILEFTENGFRLEEPAPRFVSLFRSDRLMATESLWPHWERSGESVFKYNGQEIPAGFKSYQRKGN